MSTITLLLVLLFGLDTSFAESRVDGNTCSEGIGLAAELGTQQVPQRPPPPLLSDSSMSYVTALPPDTKRVTSRTTRRSALRHKCIHGTSAFRRAVFTQHNAAFIAQQKQDAEEELNSLVVAIKPKSSYKEGDRLVNVSSAAAATPEAAEVISFLSIRGSTNLSGSNSNSSSNGSLQDSNAEQTTIMPTRPATFRVVELSRSSRLRFNNNNNKNVINNVSLSATEIKMKFESNQTHSGAEGSCACHSERATPVQDATSGQQQYLAPSSSASVSTVFGPEELYTIAVVERTKFRNGKRESEDKVVMRSGFSTADTVRDEKEQLQQRASLFSPSSLTPQPIRITFRTANLFDGVSYCTSIYDSAPDFEGGLIDCTEETILTTKKRDLLINEVLPRAGKILSSYLSVINEYDGILSQDNICGKYFTVPAKDKTTGIDNTDFVVYVAAGPIGGGTIAWAAMCAIGSDHRPVVARANFSPEYLDTATSDIEEVVRIGVHELLHALGFSPLWIDSDMFKTKNAIDYTQTRRGGQPVTLYKGPAALEAAKKHFGCSTIDGIEIEDEGGEGTAGAHWERRFHRDDVMAGIVGNVMAFSEMTFGVLEDSGHYFLNRTAGPPPKPAVSFPPPSAEAVASNDGSEAYRNGPNNGLVPNVRSNYETAKYMHRAGCGMLSSKCNTPEGGAGDYFCFQKSPAPRVCTRDYSAIGSCYVVTYSSNLPAWARYFDDPRMGGIGQLYNYCPLISSYENRICNDYRNVDANSSQYALYFARDGRCFETSESMIKEGYVFPPNETPGTARCLRARCIGGKRIEFAPSSSGPWAACPSDGSAGTVPAPTGYVGSVTCPPAVRFCTQDLFVADSTIPSTTTATSLPTTTATTLASTTSTTVATTKATTSPTTTLLPYPSTTTTATSTAAPPPTTTSTAGPHTSTSTTPYTSGPTTSTSTFLTTTGASTTTSADTSTTTSSSPSATTSTSSPAHNSTTDGDSTSAQTDTTHTSAGPTYSTTTTPKTTSDPNKSREEDPSNGAAAAGDKRDDGSSLSGGSLAAVVVVAIAIVSAASAGIAFFLVRRRGRSSSLTTAFTADVGSKNANNNPNDYNNNKTNRGTNHGNDQRKGGRSNVQTTLTTSDNNNIRVEEGNTTPYAEDGGPLGDNFSHNDQRNSSSNASFRTVGAGAGAGAAGGAARRQKGGPRGRGLSVITADEMVSVPPQTQNNKSANTKVGTTSSPIVNRGAINLEASSSYSTADGSSFVGNVSRTAFEVDDEDDDLPHIHLDRSQQHPSRAPPPMPLFSHEFENTYAPPTVASPPTSPSQAHAQQREQQQRASPTTTKTTTTPTQRTQITAPCRDGSTRGVADGTNGNSVPASLTAAGGVPPTGVIKQTSSSSGKPSTDAPPTSTKKKPSVPASPNISSPTAREQKAVHVGSPVGGPNARGVSAVFLAAVADNEDEEAPPPLDSKRAKLLGGFGGDVYIHVDSTATD